jgi:hypothetical protein
VEKNCMMMMSFIICTSNSVIKSEDDTHGECGTQRKGENAYILSVKKYGRKRPLGR